MRARLVQFGCAVLAALNLWWGLWALLQPAEFFATFPGFGHHWTAAYPPYNEHLVKDLGATFTTLGVMLAIAALVNDRRVRWVVLGGVLVFNGLHLAFHLQHPGELVGFDLAAATASLVAGVVAPAVLLALVGRVQHRTD